MKKTIIFASVALATLFAFSSCQKENLTSASNDGVRIITAEFENTATKTTLNEDGKSPEWAVDDVLRILNETSFQDVTLAAGDITDNKITFTTTLTGTLYAVYPASATTMTSCTDGNINFTIPTVQDGTFASANICVAKSSTTDETNKNNLVFRNATAVLEFNQTAAATKVLSIRVEAANAIVGPMSVSFKADGTLDDPTTSSLTGNLINAKSTEAKDRYYVAVAPVATGRIEFEYQQAIKVATVTTEAGKTLAANKIYACPSMDGETYEVKKGTINGHDYVQIGSVKWATMNIGATTVAGSASTCYGDYFAWGETAPYYKGTGGWPAIPAWNTDKDNGYAWQSYCGSISFYEWSTPPYDATTKILKPEFDAAAQILGNGWRMPTSAEFQALYEACLNGSYDTTTNPSGASASVDKGVYWCTSYDEVKGCLFCDGTNRLFFPAAGRGYGTALDYAGSKGYYWSSSLNTGKTGSAYYLYFFSGNVNPQSSSNLYYGHSVRPVSD